MPVETNTVQAGPELLRLDGIGVRLGGREILRDVSFSVRAGEFTGLIGPNGRARPRCSRSSSACKHPRPAGSCSTASPGCGAAGG